MLFSNNKFVPVDNILKLANKRQRECPDENQRHDQREHDDKAYQGCDGVGCFPLLVHLVGKIMISKVNATLVSKITFDGVRRSIS